MLPSQPAPFYRGKVRDLYPVDDERMIIVASDRISAFDVIFPEPITDKGKILTEVSNLWFQALRREGLAEKLNFTDQLIAGARSEFPEPYNGADWSELDGRSVLVRKVKRIDYECVVRGYLAGSGWKDYQRTGSVCGHDLPAGLRSAEKLPEPIFTPATKAPLGEHDENVDLDHMRKDLGAELAERLRDISLAVYKFAAAKMEAAGLILCDTKFEFGLDDQGGIVLIDEILTPDSSRYWDAAGYAPGEQPSMYDKQNIRDYLESTDWDKSPPPPALPDQVVDKTIARYRELRDRLLAVLN